jgi:transposase-like protein
MIDHPCLKRRNYPHARGTRPTTKINAVWLYLSGISMNRIAFLLRVSAQAVLNWIRTLAQTYHKRSQSPQGEASASNGMRCSMT